MAGFLGGALTFLVAMTFASLIGALRAVDKHRTPTTGETINALASLIISVFLAYAVGSFFRRN